MGALQDLKMADQKRTKTGKCRTWNMTDQIAWLENDGPRYSKVIILLFLFIYVLFVLKHTQFVSILVLVPFVD